MNDNPAWPGRRVLVRVFHNIARDEQGRHVGYGGYQHGQPVVEVFQASADSTADPAVICENIYMLLNVGDDPVFGTPDPRAIAYRRKGNRSLSAGDLICLDGTWLACARTGFQPVAEQPVIVRAADHGTAPL